MDLERDRDGSIVTRPVLGWTTAAGQGIAVIARIRYATTPADLETGGRSLQVILTPEQALLLAAELETQAARILAARASPGEAH